MAVFGGKGLKAWELGLTGFKVSILKNAHWGVKMRNQTGKEKKGLILKHKN